MDSESDTPTDALDSLGDGNGGSGVSDTGNTGVSDINNSGVSDSSSPSDTNTDTGSS